VDVSAQCTTLAADVAERQPISCLRRDRISRTIAQQGRSISTTRKRLGPLRPCPLSHYRSKNCFLASSQGIISHGHLQQIPSFLTNVFEAVYRAKLRRIGNYLNRESKGKRES